MDHPAVPMKGPWRITCPDARSPRKLVKAIACDTAGVRQHNQRLFDDAVPDGFVYRRDFVTAAEEAQLVDNLGRIAFAPFEMRGVVAKRRVAFFGRSYDSAGVASPPIPDFLVPLQHHVAAWVGVSASDFAMALVNEYAAGAPIGWHRDAPQYGIVAGISLLSSCRMKFRPYAAPQRQPRRADGDNDSQDRARSPFGVSARRGSTA